MSWFTKKKMNEKDVKSEETEEVVEETAANEAAADPANEIVPPIVAKLEGEVAVERQRREAAEHKLVGVQAKFDELRAQMERETAEMRQRLQRHNEQRMQIEKSEFLTSLLPILDNLGLAVKAGETDASFDNLLIGVRGTARMFEQTLLGLGVEPIDAVGKDFDPELHEAVEMVEAEAEMDGKITSEFSRGYKFGDRLLRPARVQVGKAAARAAE
jgi:molecular chaperone GrpE